MVGGTAPGAGNVISGNLGDCVFVGSVDSNITMNNTVAGNLIGLDATGTNTSSATAGVGVDLYGNSQSNAGWVDWARAISFREIKTGSISPGTAVK